MILQVRRWHRKIAWIAVLPAALILMTGLILHLRRIIPWIQPPAQQSSETGGAPLVDVQTAFNTLLTSGAMAQEAKVQSWNDVKSVEYKPTTGTWSFKSKNYHEVQIDGHNGRVLSVALRRSLWLMQLHEGSLFGLNVLWLVFFPAGLLLVVLEFTGVYLLFARKRKKTGDL